MTLPHKKQLFSLGEIVATPGAMESFSMAEIAGCIHRHKTGDWGDIHPDDTGINEEALELGNRILSVYKFPASEHRKARILWVITEADRSVSTALTPQEY